MIFADLLAAIDAARSITNERGIFPGDAVMLTEPLHRGWGYPTLPRFSTGRSIDSLARGGWTPGHLLPIRYRDNTDIWTPFRYLVKVNCAPFRELLRRYDDEQWAVRPVTRALDKRRPSQ